MTQTKIPKQPLQKIALSCSGGGYRAASFHLGALAYLNHLQLQGKPLLENVKMLSTVSGGTLTGIVYALRKQRGESFETIYSFLLQKLYSVDLLKTAIQKLNPDGEWDNMHKQKNLINAFSELYDREFMEGLTFAEFNEMKSHLEAVVFNSTEFNNGINFRFRNKGTGYFGNYKIRIPQEAAQEVKLSDAMAASSCFTGGFEPILWPHDFVYRGATALKNLAAGQPPVGLMDGGIYDNQGIESILNYKKNSPEPYFDLIIISDVASPYMNPFQPFKEKEKKGLRALSIDAVRRKAKRLNNAVSGVLIGLILILGIIPFLTQSGFGTNWPTGLCVGAAAILLVLLITKLIAVNLLKGFIQKQLSRIGSVIPPFFRVKLSHLHVEKLSVRRMEPLIVDRVNSLIVLLMDVFLKVVRRLNYYKLYDDKAYRHRRITNLIKELTEADYKNSSERDREDSPTASNRYRQNTILKGTYAAVVGDNIKAVAEEASSFGTTLWFTERDQLANLLDKLVATGQFTMCYNLLGYLEEIIFEEGNGFDELPPGYQQDLIQVYEQCKGDWLQFRENPFWMVQAGRQPGINNSREIPVVQYNQRLSPSPDWEYFADYEKRSQESTIIRFEPPPKKIAPKRRGFLENIKDFFLRKKTIISNSDDYRPSAEVDKGIYTPRLDKTSKPTIADKNSVEGGNPEQTKNIKDIFSRSTLEEFTLGHYSAENAVEDNRFLKGYVYEGTNKWNAQTNCLQQFTSYTLTIKIGSADKEAVMAPQTFVGNYVFKESIATTERIQLLFKPRNQDDAQPQLGQIELPREGESSTFDFTFTTTDTDFEGEVYAYHNNRLLQRLTLLAPVRERASHCAEAAIRFKMDFCIRQQLSNLNEGHPFHTSLFLDAQTGNVSNLTALVGNQLLEFRYNKATEKLSEDLKKIIEDSFKRSFGDTIDQEDLDSEKARLLFYRLAFKGNDLFNTLFKKDKSLKGPFQIITKQVEYVPLDFVYTRACPEPGAKVCQHAKAALRKGACQNCHPGSDERTYICPFGFWALSEVIERHHINYVYNGHGDYCLKFEPTSARKKIPVLEETLYAASARVDAQKPGLIKEVSSTIKLVSSRMEEATDWKQFEQLADDMDPDSIILIVHTELNDEAQAEQLEIGDQNFLIKNNLNEALLKASGSTKNPFTIILGCDTANIAHYGFDITTQLMQEGVAIVISNFTKIRGSHAGETVKKLVTLLKQHAGTGVTMGELLLKARQQLVADGLLVSLTLAAQGDADWIL